MVQDLTQRPTAFSLSQQSLSKRGQVLGFCGDAALIERLKELGLHAGVCLEYLGRAPFRGPLLFRWGVTVLALREEEAMCPRIQIL